MNAIRKTFLNRTNTKTILCVINKRIQPIWIRQRINKMKKKIVLDVDAFERLLGPCMEIMKRSIGDYETQLIKIFGSKNNITDIR